jgi:hypothetical protein
MEKSKGCKQREMQGFANASRALWYELPGVIPRLIASLPLLEGVIGVDSSGRAQLKLPVIFSKMVGEAMNNHLSKEIASNETHVPGEKTMRRSRHAAMTKWLKLWSPFDSRLQLAGIATNGTTVREPMARSKLLADYWGEVSSKKEINVEKANAFANEHQPRLDLSKSAPPSFDSIARSIRIARHSAPGPDGLPFSSWAAAGETGVMTLYLVMCELLDGLAPPRRSITTRALCSLLRMTSLMTPSK